MSRSAWGIGLALAVGAALAVQACKVYDESLVEGTPPAGNVPKEFRGSGVGWWSTKTSNGCISAGVPTADGRPKNAGGDNIPHIYVAVRSMALGSLDRNQEPTEGAWKDLGFDLDGLCTSSDTCPQDPGTTLSCKTIGAIPPDGRYCRDNSFGKLEAEAVNFQGVGKEFGLSNDGFNCALCRGDYNFIIQISDYNGQPNDSNVRIDLYPSPGIETKPGWQCSLSTAEGAWKANECWTKDSKWTIQKDTFDGQIPADGDLPPAKLNDPSAYVRDGYIVGQLPADALFWFPGESAARAYPLTLQGGVFAGRLEQKDGTWVIEDGTIAGRAKVSDMLGGFALLGVCEGHEFYGPINLFVNGALDVLANGSVSPEATCDAVSVGIGFRAEEASFSTTPVDVTPLPGCPVDGGTGGAAGAGTGGTGTGGTGTGGTGTGGTGAGGTGGTAGDAGPADASAE